MRNLIAGVFLVVSWCVVSAVNAQDIAVKTNLLYWSSTTPNIGAEFGLGKRTTLELAGGYNPWTLDEEANKKIKHWLFMPEFRYWLCERFNGHFFGLHSGYTQYNVSGISIPLMNMLSEDYRYEGWAAGIGISYGYSWIMSRRWNLEATIGLGYAYSNYDKYECATCGKYVGNKDKHYFGPTKAGISLIYIVK
ncbi:MAG: DUF3575 domain-containing protein [Dysgonamonadaceae bacterium]|jgi:hypothetical protein|nr:DUF3575 domain-containing protein [Dysgonamonadaceae bacterium]